MKFLPLFIQGHNRLVVIVGGGKVALRKVRLLLRAGFRVKLVAPEITPALQALAATDQALTLLEQTYDKAQLANAFLVIAASDDTDLNQQIREDGRQQGMLVNRVDNASDSDFILPSSFTRDPIQIAVSTAGASPLLARSLLKHLENCTPRGYGKLATLIQVYREQVKQKLTGVEQRRIFWEQVLQSRVADLVFEDRYDEAEEMLQALLQDKVEGQLAREPKALERPAETVGEVYLVGAGPGDPDLLTFKALRLMQQADVVLYDRLVSQPILDMLNEESEKIYAGKERDMHTIPQMELNQLLIYYARKGKRVLRLKGGDPFIFGRGGEEIQSLMEEQIPFQIVPGITAASGCSAYAGIPLTHRDYAHSCVFAAGHLKDGSIQLNWEVLVQDKQTIVFYMGLKTLAEICKQLQKHGMSGDTPAALVAQGTTKRQRVLTGNLTTLPEQVSKAAIKPPTILIVGQVVQLHKHLGWFEPRLP